MTGARMIDTRTKVRITGDVSTAVSSANGKPYVIDAKPGQRIDVPPRAAADLIKQGVAAKGGRQ